MQVANVHTLPVVDQGKDTIRCRGKTLVLNAGTVSITAIKDPPAGFLADTLQICHGQLIEIKPLSVFNHYNWYNGASSRNINITKPGSYWL